MEKTTRDRIRLMCLICVTVLLGVVAKANVIAQSGAGGDQIKVLEQLESDVEHTAVFERSGQVVILTESQIESEEDLLAYKSNAMRRFASLSPTDTQIAAVTFISPLAIEEVESILGKVEIRRLRFVSKPFGGGKLSYPPAAENMELSIAEHMKEHHGVNDFRLVDGYVAAEIQGTTTSLQSLQESEHVFLVDVGAVELREKYKEATIMVGDVYYRYNNFIDEPTESLTR